MRPQQFPLDGVPCLAPFLLVLVLGACSQGNSPQARDGDSTKIAPRILRSQDPRVIAARAALDRADMDNARALVSQAAPLAAAPEGDLLRARLCLLEGDMNGAEQALARARRVQSDDPRVLATSAEIHAWAGMLQTAEGELAAAALRPGDPVPELLRARGVVLIASPGGARPGLALLEQARSLDPDLPFMGRALAQAHLLVGRSHLGTDRELALKHARAAVLAEPSELDALVFLGDALILNGEWGDALRTFEEALLLGRPMEMELAGHYKRAGFVALAQGKRSLGIKSFLRARELGLGDQEFGSAAEVLRVEARKLMAGLTSEISQAQDPKAKEAVLARVRELAPDLDELRLYRAAEALAQGVAAIEEGDFLAAGVFLDQALTHDPDSLEAHLYRGHAFHAEQNYLLAAEQWQWVLDDLRRDGISLPEPLHLRLADALVRADRAQSARQVLESYLRSEEDDRWKEQTRLLLQTLPSEADLEPGGSGAESGGEGASGGGTR